MINYLKIRILSAFKKDKQKRIKAKLEQTFITRTLWFFTVSNNDTELRPTSKCIQHIHYQLFYTRIYGYYEYIWGGGLIKRESPMLTYARIRLSLLLALLVRPSLIYLLFDQLFFNHLF